MELSALWPWVGFWGGGAEREAAGAGPGAKSGIIFVPLLVAPGPGSAMPSVPSSPSWQAPEGRWGRRRRSRGTLHWAAVGLPYPPPLLAAGRGRVGALPGEGSTCQARPWAGGGGGGVVERPGRQGCGLGMAGHTELGAAPFW